MSPPRTIEISLLGRTFKVPCSKEEEPQLISAVEYLDGKMRAIRENSKVIGVERIAMMAGLNIAHELLFSGGGSSREPEYREKLAAMEAELDRALADQDKLFDQPKCPAIPRLFSSAKLLLHLTRSLRCSSLPAISLNQCIRARPRPIPMRVCAQHVLCAQSIFGCSHLEPRFKSPPASTAQAGSLEPISVDFIRRVAPKK